MADEEAEDLGVLSVQEHINRAVDLLDSAYWRQPNRTPDDYINQSMAHSLIAIACLLRSHNA